MVPQKTWLVLGCIGLACSARCQAQTAAGLDVRTADPVVATRPASAFVAGVIEEGLCRSATIRSMVATLQTSDVIVYVEMKPLSDRRVAAGLEYLGATTTDRILRVVLGFPLSTAPREWRCLDTSFSTRVKWREHRRYEARRVWRATIALTECLEPPNGRMRRRLPDERSPAFVRS